MDAEETDLKYICTDTDVLNDLFNFFSQKGLGENTQQATQG